MKSPFLGIIAFWGMYILHFSGCKYSHSDADYHLRCDSLLIGMEKNLYEFIPNNQNRDSQSRAMNLTTLRYQLQSAMYEIESRRVPKEDSLYWVGAQYLASTYFQLSWEFLPLLFQNNRDVTHITQQMTQKERDAIRFYLKYWPEASVRIKLYWEGKIKSQ